jgi:hypothetical protein
VDVHARDYDRTTFPFETAATGFGRERALQASWDSRRTTGNGRLRPPERAIAFAVIRMRLPFTWVADFYTLFAAGQRVRIPNQHDWLCNNRFTIR